MLTPKHYKDALAVQDASNLSGVVYDWAEVMKRVCEEAYAAGKGPFGFKPNELKSAIETMLDEEEA